MKKILITFLVLILSLNYTFAEECSIQNDSSPGLKQYINNNKAVLKEIMSQIGKDETQASFTQKTFGTIKEQGLRFYNRVFTFDGYFSGFKYFAVFPISNEIPQQIKRDNTLLENEREGINRYVRSLLKTVKSDVVIKNICSKVNGTCNIPDEITASELLQKLSDNNDKIISYFRKVIMGDEMLKTPDLILVPTNFTSDIQTYYNKDAYGTCSKAEGGFFARIEEKIKEISNMQFWIKDGVKKWQDARALAIGKDTSLAEQQQVEKKLLMEYAGKQGIYGDSQSNLLSALEKFDQDGLSEDSNFLYNMYNNTKNKIMERGKLFYDDQIGDYFDKFNTSSTSENSPVPINTTILVQNNSDTSKQVKEKLDSMYLELLSFEAPSERDTSTLIARIIKSHIDILDAIENLTDSCEKSVLICQQQGQGLGDCGKCN